MGFWVSVEYYTASFICYPYACVWITILSARKIITTLPALPSETLKTFVGEESSAVVVYRVGNVVLVTVKPFSNIVGTFFVKHIPDVRILINIKPHTARVDHAVGRSL